MSEVETVDHGVGRPHLGVVVKVRVDVGRGAEIAVAHPLLDLLHRYTAGDQQAGRRMTKLV